MSLSKLHEVNHKQHNSNNHLSFLLLFLNLKCYCCFSLFVEISKLKMNFHWFNNYFCFLIWLIYKNFTQPNIHIYKAVGDIQGCEGVATLSIISDLHNCDTDLLKAFHFAFKVVWVRGKQVRISVHSSQHKDQWWSNLYPVLQKGFFSHSSEDNLKKFF